SYHEEEQHDRGYDSPNPRDWQPQPPPRRYVMAGPAAQQENECGHQLRRDNEMLHEIAAASGPQCDADGRCNGENTQRDDPVVWVAARSVPGHGHCPTTGSRVGIGEVGLVGVDLLTRGPMEVSCKLKRSVGPSTVTLTPCEPSGVVSRATTTNRMAVSAPPDS